MENTLKPCPFCKEIKQKFIISKNFMGEYRVEHFCTFTILGRKYHKNIEEAIAEWNNRYGFLEERK